MSPYSLLSRLARILIGLCSLAFATAPAHARPFRFRVPIIAFNASAFHEDIDRCLQVGMAGFVTKPFVRQALVDEVAPSSG